MVSIQQSEVYFGVCDETIPHVGPVTDEGDVSVWTPKPRRASSEPGLTGQECKVRAS